MENVIIDRNFNMQILVDADACPVKQETIEIAKQFNIDVCLVASYNHYLPTIAGVKTVQVDFESQAADMYIANLVKRSDIVLTHDFGLACLVLAKQAYALSFRGEPYSSDSIDYLLERRAESAKIRRQGGKTKGPKPFTSDDRKKFQQSLTKLLIQLAGE